MNRARLAGPIAGASVTVLLLGALLLAPAAVGRSLKSSYHDLPDPVTGVVPDGFEQFLGRSMDNSIRFLSFGNPEALIQTDLRLSEASPPAATWWPLRFVQLSWTDLGNDQIEYEVRYASFGLGFAASTLAAVTPRANATIELPDDGAYSVFVQPKAGAKRGHVSTFGPFFVDSTVPPAPVLEPRGDPLGYRFQINWTGSVDASGILGYDVERSVNAGPFATLARAGGTTLLQDQMGNGVYQYRIRAVNGAGLRSVPSNTISIVVRAPMQNPGAGDNTYGIHANYTGFLYLWDLVDMDQYVSITDVPQDLKDRYLGGGYGIEIENQTLRSIVQATVGNERSTAKIAEKLFVYLFDQTDYDSAKLAGGGNLPLQRANETLDRGKGICGDLATLYLTLLRIAGVPARPVHGYLDNTLAGVGGFHMWVEVYVGPPNAPRPWMTVDVSGVSGERSAINPTGDNTYKPEYLFAYFGIFNPDYLALGVENDYTDNSWNTWARFTYTTNGARPQIADRTTVVEYASEEGCLFFNTQTRETKYVKETASGGCPNEPGFTNYYQHIKGVSKKRIDYGATVETPPGLPNCLAVRLRYPATDELGAINSDQSVLYQIYENSNSVNTKVGEPGADGWLKFVDGTSANCNL